MKIVNFLIFLNLIFLNESLSNELQDRVVIKEGMEKEEALLLIKKVSERSKFAFSDKGLFISTTGKKKPRHDDLLGKNKKISGGYILFKIKDEKLIEVIIDNYSGRLCPTYKSLSKVSTFLSHLMGLGVEIILVNKPNLDRCQNSSS